MTTRTLTARGDADPDAVWEQYLHPALWSQWSPQIAGVRVASGAHPGRPSQELAIAAGMRGTVYGPFGTRVGFVIDEVTVTGGSPPEPGPEAAVRSWSWTVQAGPFTIRLRHTVRPTTAGTVTQLTLRGCALVVLPYCAPAQLAITRLVRR